MLLGVAGQLLCDAGLADAGLAGDHHDLAAPAERLVERAAQSSSSCSRPTNVSAGAAMTYSLPAGSVA